MGAPVPPPARRDPRPPHQWNWVGKFWQCGECLKSSRNTQDRPPVPGHCSNRLKVHPAALRALGHKCIVADCRDGSFVCFFQRCFFYSTGGQLRGLGDPCPQRPQAPALVPADRDKKSWSAGNARRKEVWSKLCKGLHPKRAGVHVDLDGIGRL